MNLSGLSLVMADISRFFVHDLDLSYASLAYAKLDEVSLNPQPLFCLASVFWRWPPGGVSGRMEHDHLNIAGTAHLDGTLNLLPLAPCANPATRGTAGDFIIITVASQVAYRSTLIACRWLAWNRLADRKRKRRAKNSSGMLAIRVLYRSTESL